MIDLHQIDQFNITGRGLMVICAESYYDFNPPPVMGSLVRIDGKLARIRGIEAFMTNPPNYGEHLSILIGWEDEDFEWTWRNFCPYIGYHVRLSGPIPETYRERKHALAVRKLERVVAEFDPEARVVRQPERTDRIGFPEWWVTVWVHPGVEDFRDVFGMREHLEEHGHHVSSFLVSYEPAMA